MRDISLYLSTIPDYNQMLAGKNVLITTAARGIGKSIALLFARQGADVYFGGRNEEYVRTTEKELQSIRPGCRGYVVDLAKADQTEAFVDAAVKDSGGFDILVSTVGVNCHCPAAEYKDEDMFRLLETNYLSGVRCARKVIPTMQARGGGSIINISSIHSLMSQPTNMLYAGTKGAMNAAARVMALDYAKDNIRVNTICPGVVISDVMYDDMDKLDDAGKKQLDAALHRCQPLEPGRMQDIANTALFFASNMSANITGHDLCHLGLLFGAAGQDEAALGGLLDLNSLDNNTVCKRNDLHRSCPPIINIKDKLFYVPGAAPFRFFSTHFL